MFLFHYTVPQKGPLTKQIVQIAQFLKAQPQPKSGKFSVNFKDIVNNYMPPSLADEMVPLNLKMMSDFEDKMIKESEGTSQINIQIMKKPPATTPASGKASNVGVAMQKLPPAKAKNEVNVTRPPIPHVSSILSKASCVADSRNNKQATMNKEENLKMLAAIAASKEEEAIVAAAETTNEEEGPEDFFPAEDLERTSGPGKVNVKPQEINREASLMHVQPILDTEENPFEGNYITLLLTV